VLQREEFSMVIRIRNKPADLEEVREPDIRINSTYHLIEVLTVH
jgi:hypothetical protein